VWAVWLAVLGWSATSLFVRAAHAPALVFTMWRLWFALPPLAAVMVVRRRQMGGRLLDNRISPARALRTAIIAGAWFASAAGTTFLAIDKTRLLDVTLIAALQPVVIITVAVLFLRERVELRYAVYASIAVLGTALVATSSGGSGTWSLVGELIAVASLFLNAGWYLYGRIVRQKYAVDPFVFMFGALAAAAVLITPVAYASEGSLRLPGEAYLWAAATMAVGTTSHVLLVWAHRYLPAARSAPLLLAEPVIVAVAAWVCFGESLGPVEIVGSLAVVAALWGMVRSPAVTHVEADVPDPAPAT
jgi:drug/metabolite transporter (DMT)-like permease